MVQLQLKMTVDLLTQKLEHMGDRSVVTPVPDKTPLTVILFADMLVVVNIFV